MSTIVLRIRAKYKVIHPAWGKRIKKITPDQRVKQIK